MSLQMPGLGLGSGEPTTVDIDFLEKGDSPVYTLKGEVFIQSTKMKADSVFFPDSLTGSQKIISKIRIKAAEIGMSIKIFDSPSAPLPNLLLTMKTGFLMKNDRAVEIDFLEKLDERDVFMDKDEVKIDWFKRDTEEIKRLNGIHVARIEVHVQRTPPEAIVPYTQFVPIALADSSSPIQAMNDAVNAASFVKSKNVAIVPSQQNIQPAQILMINSPGSGAQFPLAA